MTWNAPERRFFETGLDRGVLYPKGTPREGLVVASNRAGNPSFEIASADAPVDVSYNLLENPSAETAGGWIATAGFWTVTRDTSVFKTGTKSVKSVVTGTTISALAITDVGQLGSTGTSVISSLKHSAGIWLRSAQSGYRGKLGMSFFDTLGNSVGSIVFGPSVNLTANTWTYVVVENVTPADSVIKLTAVVETVSGSNATVGHIAYADGAVLVEEPVAPKYFDGASSDESDFSYAWSGTAHQSQSVRRATSVGDISAGLCVAVQSSDWASTGTKSLRIYSKFNSTGSAYVDIGSYAPDWGKTYTVRVKCRVREQLAVAPRINMQTTGLTPNANVDSSVPLTGGVVVPGVYDLSLTFSYPAFQSGAAKYLRLYNGNIKGTSVWFDDLLVMEGGGMDLNGDYVSYFSGDTEVTSKYDYLYDPAGGTYKMSWKKENLTLAVPWDGLTSVEESGGEGAKAYYVDGRPFLFLPMPKEYKATLNAYTYPDAFSAIMGVTEVTDGMYLDSQPGAAFDLSYRTLVGNGIQSTDHGYKIHLVYNATVTPGALSYETLSDSINPSTMSWEIQAVPVKVEGFRPTAHIIIDTRHMDPAKVQALEELLYGSSLELAGMPAPQVVFDILNYGDMIIVRDNGDGTFDVEGSYENVYMISDGEFRIDNIDGQDNGDGTFTISTTEA